ncbi:hypothetical protein RIF29_36485 [Crotalaria pallida]|uniref:Uncharacterized protein n=1 Tax=Crotalaria pallida TaxID=3830 RepID=A0AAN9HVS4_CROPI
MDQMRFIPVLQIGSPLLMISPRAFVWFKYIMWYSPKNTVTLVLGICSCPSVGVWGFKVVSQSASCASYLCVSLIKQILILFLFPLL